MATTPNLGITKLEISDRSNDPRRGHESRNAEQIFREQLDDSFQIIDDYTANLAGTQVAFSASDETNWSGSLAPTTVAAALNRIAAILAISGSFA